uniref:Uncharacterized protein n=1 Tax=Panagrolaimus sp. ES5 TaxID=591445 RepID=A0AC34FQL4_9BILA
MTGLVIKRFASSSIVRLIDVIHPKVVSLKTIEFDCRCSTTSDLLNNARQLSERPSLRIQHLRLNVTDFPLQNIYEILRLLSSVTTDTAWISIFTDKKFNSEIYSFVSAHNLTGTGDVVGPFQSCNATLTFTAIPIQL